MQTPSNGFSMAETLSHRGERVWVDRKWRDKQEMRVIYERGMRVIYERGMRAIYERGMLKKKSKMK